MPRRMRTRPELIPLTKVKKKTVENKRENMEKVRDYVDKYSYIYVYDVDNYRNHMMKQLKLDYKHNGAFYQGKVKPTKVALGRNQQTEYRENLHLLSHALEYVAKGAHRGLFFTNNEPTKTLQKFNDHKVTTFAKTGFVATKDYKIDKGALNQFVFSQEYQLKRLGLPVILKEGRLILNHDYILCETGQPLRPEQCKLLELLNEPMAQFSINIHGYWTNGEYYECVPSNKLESDAQDNDDEKEDIENNKDMPNNKDSQQETSFLDQFVDDDDSSDEDIDIE